MTLESKKYSDPYDDLVFDRFDIVDGQLDYENVEVKYTATFMDSENLDPYDEGFHIDTNHDYYEGSHDLGFRGGFESIELIVDLFPVAKKYHAETNKVEIHKYIDITDKNGKLLLHIYCGFNCMKV